MAMSTPHVDVVLAMGDHDNPSLVDFVKLVDDHAVAKPSVFLSRDTAIIGISELPEEKIEDQVCP